MTKRTYCRDGCNILYFLLHHHEVDVDSISKNFNTFYFIIKLYVEPNQSSLQVFVCKMQHQSFLRYSINFHQN